MKDPVTATYKFTCGHSVTLQVERDDWQKMGFAAKIRTCPDCGFKLKFY